MPTYDIFVKVHGEERYSVEAGTPEEAMRKHERGESGLKKDDETFGVDEVRIIDRATGIDVTPDDDLLPDEPVEKMYGVRLWATFRASAETVVMATSFDEAVKKAAAIEVGGPILDFHFQIPDGNSPEGDETCHVYGPEDDQDESDLWSGEGVEVDMRKASEPFSWEACKIVKELAALHNMSNPTFVSEKFQDLLKRAADACTKE